MVKYHKNKAHPTYKSYLRHAWELARETNRYMKDDTL